MSQDFKLTRAMAVEAGNQGMNLSAFLEAQDPTNQHPAHERGLDAFGRQMARLDIRSRSNPRLGIMAHPFERFYDDGDGQGEERKTLLPEWLARQYRQACPVVPRSQYKAQMGESRSPTVSTHRPLSDVIFPDALDPTMRFQPLEPSLLSLLVARTRMINSDTFKAFYLADATTEAAARMKRVGEYAPVPIMRITGSDHTIRVQKYGRRLQASYESMRRMSIDLISWAVQYIAFKADNDKFLHAIDIIINGDGNSGTPLTSTNGSTLDGAASSVLTLKMWLAWGMLWKRPFQMNVALGTDASILSLLLLNAGSANLPPEAIVRAPGAGGVGGQVILAKSIYGSIQAINDSTVTANALVGIDGRFTLEMVQEVGADMVEFDRIVSAQYEEVVLTEVAGFDIMTLGQNRSLLYTA